MSSQAYIGGYTSQDGGGEGIARVTAGPDGLSDPGLAVATPDPSFLAVSPDGRFLYAVHELDAGQVGAFAIEPDGALRSLGQQSTHGMHPCHLAVHPSGRYVLSANYSSGSVAVHPIGPDGALGEATHVVQHEGSGPNAERQDGPHAHQVVVTPDGGYVLAVDLGTDTVYSYLLDPDSGRLTEHARLVVDAGSGPRHLEFAPDGRTAYLITELASTLVVCDVAEGRLDAVQTVSTRPDGATGDNFPAEVLVSADGRFVYGSNRGDDTVAVFATSDGGRAVELVRTVGCGGSWPRHLAFGNDGRLLYAANERSDAIATFAVDTGSGVLTDRGTPLPWPKPVCVLLV